MTDSRHVGQAGTGTGSGLLALWSAPRSRSTAFYRAVLERGDVMALHEPFCNVVDYGETTVGGRTVYDHGHLVAELWRHAAHAVVFFKDTTDYEYRAVLEDRRLLAEATHTFLLRRPEEIVASHFALNPGLAVDDVGVELLHRLFEAVTSAAGRQPVVVDSDDLVTRPQETLRAWCAAVGLPPRDDALSWRSGPRLEWQRSHRWHRDVEASEGIERRPQTYEHTPGNNPLLAELCAHHQPFYARLYQERLRLG